MKLNVFLRGSFRRAAAVLAVFGLLCVSAYAQQGRGIVAGMVLDSAGSAVPNAQIKLTPLGITGVSDGQGAFRIPDVPAGHYTVTVNYVGFAPQSSDVTVAAGQTMTYAQINAISCLVKGVVGTLPKS